MQYRAALDLCLNFCHIRRALNLDPAVHRYFAISMDPRSEVWRPPPRAFQPSPLRVLVQTLTHLVPSDGVYADDLWFDKSVSMVNRICRYHWKCRLGPGIRWYGHGTEFGYNKRRCFFLFDCGKADNDADVPILCYKWTGESLYVVLGVSISHLSVV